MQLPLETLEPEDAERVKQLRSAAAIFFTGFANNDSRWFILTVLFPEIGEEAPVLLCACCLRLCESVCVCVHAC